MNEGMLAAIVIGAGVGLLFLRVSALERRVTRLSRIEAKLDALLKHAGVEADPLQDVPAGVREALEHGERLLAIARLRQATGMGLKEAKERVDQFRG